MWRLSGEIPRGSLQYCHNKKENANNYNMGLMGAAKDSE
jgi:hypothetical protein